jgi:hypothetical protein
VALLTVEVEGWPPIAPIKRGGLGLNFHLYNANDRQDDERGSWKIDVITVD